MAEKKLHWTQTEAGKKKMSEHMKTAWTTNTKLVRKRLPAALKAPELNASIIGRLESLVQEANLRLAAIDQEISDLQTEKDQIMRAFKNDYHRQNEEN